MTLTDRRAVLAAVKRGDLTWKGYTRVSYRLWSSETESRILTPSERKLLQDAKDEGLIYLWIGGGYKGGRGGIELTSEGDRHLAKLVAS